MNPRFERAATIARAVVHEARAEKITFLAGSIAYHAFVSMLPLLVLVLAVVTTVGDTTLERGVIAVTRAVLTPGASDLVVAELRRAGASTGVSALGLAVLVWGTLRIFRGLDTAFSVIYESEAANTVVDQFADGIVVLVAFGLAVIAAAAVESAVDLGGGPAGWLLGRIALAVGIGAALFPMYYLFPDEDVGVLEVLPGALVSAVGLTAFETLFRLYVEVSGRSDDASVVAGVLVLLTWLYFSGLVVLLGATVNAVTSNRSRDVDVDPVFGGVPRSASRGAPDRDEVVDALDRLDRLLADGAGEFEVTAGGETVTLPAPGTVVTDTGERSLVFGRGPVGIELRWSPRESE